MAVALALQASAALAVGAGDDGQRVCRSGTDAPELLVAEAPQALGRAPAGSRRGARAGGSPRSPWAACIGRRLSSPLRTAARNRAARSPRSASSRELNQSVWGEDRIEAAPAADDKSKDAPTSPRRSRPLRRRDSRPELAACSEACRPGETEPEARVAEGGRRRGASPQRSGAPHAATKKTRCVESRAARASRKRATSAPLAHGRRGRGTSASAWPIPASRRSSGAATTRGRNTQQLTTIGLSRSQSLGAQGASPPRCSAAQVHGRVGGRA